MAGSNKLSYGVLPVVGTGGSSTPKVREYSVVNGYITAIGQHHPVCLVASGNVERYASTAGAKSSAIVGIAAHFVSSTGTGRKVAVYDDPNQLFEIQFAGNTTTNLAGTVGLNFKVRNPNTYNSTMRGSLMLLDPSSGSATNITPGIRPFKCIALSRNVDKDEIVASGSYLGVIVKFNQNCHLYAKGTGQGI